MTQRVSCSVCIQRETRILTELLTVLLNYGSTAHQIRSTKRRVYKQESIEHTYMEHVRDQHSAMYRLVGWRSSFVYAFVCMRVDVSVFVIPLRTIFVMNDYH